MVDKYSNSHAVAMFDRNDKFIGLKGRKGVIRMTSALKAMQAQMLAWWRMSELAEDDGAALLRVADRSGNGHDLVQPVAGKRPTVAKVGSAKVARFAAGKWLACTQFGKWPLGGGVPQPLTLVAVVKPADNPGNFGMVMGGEDAGAGARLLIDGTTTKAVYMYAGASGAGPVGPSLADGKMHIVVASMGTASFMFSVDGHVISAGATQAQGANTLANFVMGNLSTEANQYTGDIAEAVVLGGRLTLEQHDMLVAELAEQYGIDVAPSAGAGAWEQTTSPNGQAVRIFAGSQQPTTAVIWAHPHSHDEKLAPGYWGYGYAHAAQAQGWVFAASAQHGDCWGNAQGQADLVDLASMLMARYPTIRSVVVMGASMGGLSALNVAADGTIAKLKGVYLVDPVCSLSTLFAANAGTYSASIRTAYGIAADGSDYATKTAGFDPMVRAASAYAGAYVRFTASAADVVVGKAANADAMAARIAGVAGESSVLDHLGGHLSGGAANPADFLAFVRRIGAA